MRSFFYTCYSPSSVLIFFFLMIRRPPRSTLSLHDALPICLDPAAGRLPAGAGRGIHLHRAAAPVAYRPDLVSRSEEHTSELQSPDHLVSRLLLEKKNEFRA